MKKIVALLVLAGFALIPLIAEQMKTKPVTVSIDKELRALSRLQKNYLRSIQEYDATNDASSDTLLWSEKKTSQEAEKLLTQILVKRDLLRMSGSEQLARQERVEGWDFYLSPDTDMYTNTLKVLQRMVDKAPSLRPIADNELHTALQKKYLREALSLLTWTQDESEYSDFRPRFGNTAEGDLLDLLIIQQEYKRTILPIEMRLLPDRVTQADREWNASMPALTERADKVMAKLKSTEYKAWSQGIYDRVFGDKYISLSAEVTDIDKGTVALALYGIFGKESKLKRQASQPISIGNIPKGIVRMKYTDHLPKVGAYSYSVDNQNYTLSSIWYTKLYVTSTKLPNNEIQILALDRTNGRPLKGVKATAEGLVKATDKEGKTTFRMRERAYEVLVSDSRLSEPYRVYIPALPTEVEKRVHTQAHFYLDRPIYRRGQAVKVGVVVARIDGEDNKTLPNYTLDLILKANRGAEQVVLATTKVTTNAQGVAETSFDLPSDDNLSYYRIESPLGTEVLEVEDYKLSYLSVTIDSIPSGAVKDKPMIVVGKTTDLNGHPISASVQLELDTDSRYQVTSGSDGLFSLETKPLEDGYLFLRLTASDALGNVASYARHIETHDTDMPLRANLLHQDRSANKHHFTLSTESQPYAQQLLGDLSKRHVFAQLVGERDSVQLGELPIQGMKELSLPHLTSGKYAIKLYTTDGYGKRVEDVSPEIYFYAPEDKELKGDYLLWGERLESGDVLYGSSYNQCILYSMYREGTLVHQGSVELKAGRLQRLTLPSISADEVSLLTVRNMREVAVVIPYSSPSDVSAKARLKGLDFTDSFLPGQEFSKVIQVLDKSGKPLAKSPVIATVFDKAVADAAANPSFWSLISYPQDRWSMNIRENALFGFTMPRAMKSQRFAVQEAELDESVLIGYAGGMPTSEELRVRTNFAETAYYSALLLTDERGEVKLSFKMPDTQTKYITKLYAFSTDLREQVMDGATFEVYTPLSIELSTPRFLTWGDTLEGQAVLRNTSDKPLSATYTVATEGTTIGKGTTTVPAKGTTAVPFSIIAPKGEEIRIQGRVTAGDLSDGVEQVIPLQSDLSTYIVAQPLSAYKQTSVMLSLPKMELSDSPLMLQLYLDPIQLLLSKLAQNHSSVDLKAIGIFGTVHYYGVYSRVQRYMREHPSFAKELQSAASRLRRIEQKPSNWMDRIAAPCTLADFYTFITDDAMLTQRLAQMEQTIYSYAYPSGGFVFSCHFAQASPWLTHYILDTLGGIEVKSPDLRKHLEKSLTFLESELQRERSYYRDFIGYALIAHKYSHKLPDFGKPMKEQVEYMQKNYQTTSNSQMLRYAEYSRMYEQGKRWQDVRQFIQDRSGFTRNDDEKLALMLFLQKDEAKIGDEIVRFALQTKQNTIWYDRGILDVAEVILDKIAPTRIAPNASIVIGGQSYQLTPEEQTTGVVSMAYPAKAQQLSISWSGIESDYVFGGVSYLVTEPSAKATRTGEKLKIEKQVYVRQLDAEGNQTFALAEHVKKGDKIIVRYLIEAAQDLSLVSVIDARPATSEFGYDFEGYRSGDYFWWHYSRRDTHDRLYIDYLPRGRHQIELEAVASQSGSFTYGPAEIQSYYTPEYAGNSSGATLKVAPNP